MILINNVYVRKILIQLDHAAIRHLIKKWNLKNVTIVTN